MDLVDDAAAGQLDECCPYVLLGLWRWGASSMPELR